MAKTESDRAAWPDFNASVERAMKGHKTIGEVVYDLLRDAIITGQFAPSQRLRQESLAEAIGVSRIPVRTALMQLESEGLVDFHPRRGAVVRSLTPEQVREIYEIREVLETHALIKSMASLSAERLAKLRDLAGVLDDQPEGPEFTDYRIEFYRALYDSDRNPQLVKMIEDLRQAVGRYLLNRRVSNGHGPGTRTHSTLVDHIAGGDVTSATGWLRHHLETVREGVEQLIKESEAPQRKGGPRTRGVAAAAS